VAESEVAGGGGGRGGGKGRGRGGGGNGGGVGGWGVSSSHFYPFFSCYLFAPSSTREPVHRQIEYKT